MSRYPTTASRSHAEAIAKLSTRTSFDGVKMIGRVVEVGTRFAVLIDKGGKPYGAAPLA